MRIATLYDIHGNLPALEAVLAEIEKEDVDAIVVGGDALAGPLPAETLAQLQSIKTATHFIHGNHESELVRHLNGEPPAGLSPVADALTPKIADKLSVAQQKFVRSWAATVQLESPSLGKILFCHATPHNNTHVFTRETPAAKVEPIFDGVMADVVICGHTHMQFDRKINDVRVVNSGSIGMPFGEAGAHWLLIDNDVTFKRTEFDREAAAERIRQPGSLNGEAFANGNILSTPTAEVALGMLAGLESKQLTKK
ncbi:MAG: metallophosphoesterase [Anaerolineae bacterium]